MSCTRPTNVNTWAMTLAHRTVHGTTCRASEVYCVVVALLERFAQDQVEEIINLVSSSRMRGESFKEAGLRIAQMMEEHINEAGQRG